MRPFQLLIALAALSSDPALAQTPPANCTAAEYRSLDFLEGRWDSIWLAQNVRVGSYTFARAADGCALTILWEGAPNFPGTGAGIDAYDAVANVWRHTYVDEKGQVTRLQGMFADGGLHYEGDVANPATNTTMLVRADIVPQDDGTVSESFRVSRDGGATWTPFGNFLLTRSTS